MRLNADFVYDFFTSAFVRLKRMETIPTGHITENIFAIKTGSVNLYIYKKGPDSIAIDAGFGRSVLKRELAVMGIDPSCINSVFLTHSDFDHTKGLPVFENAEVYLSSDEEQMITGKIARKFGLIYNGRVNQKYRLLKSDEEITVGTINVKAIATPGHTPGSMSYLVDDSYLFVGDSFKLMNQKAYPIGPFFSMDQEMQQESMRKLARLKNVHMAFTGHRGYTTDFGYAMMEWIESR